MKRFLIRAALVLSTAAQSSPAVPVNSSTEAAREKELAAYNIVWDSQSKGSADSMPLAGGNLGLNVWVENNDLLFLIASPNCMDENGMQVKLGLIRLRFDQPVFDKDFRQELKLLESEVVVSGNGPSGKPVKATLWCEVNQPVIHVGIDSEEPRKLTASYETWSGYQASHHGGGFEWVKRLPEENPRRLRDIKAQGMEEFSKHVPDPLSKLTLGGRLDAPGMVSIPPTTGKFNNLETQVTAVSTAAPVSKIDLTITLRMEQDESLDAWKQKLASSAKQAAASARESRAAALDWWKSFWDRSHISINPGEANPEFKIQNPTSPAGVAWQAGRNYQLVRYTMAANTSGRAMTLFNGGVFACSGNPDQRNWDGCQFMAQNQRLVYWPMLRAGDFDLLKVAGDFYRDRTKLRRLHAKKFWDVDGVTYPEPFSIFGLDAIGTTAQGRSLPGHLHYNYTSNMDFALMMLEMERYTGKSFPDYIEPALGIISYFDNYYQKATRERTGKPLDEHGRLVIYPASARETYHGCTNNTDVIAGLTALSRELLALPNGRLSASQRSFLDVFRKRIPDFPVVDKDGRKFFAAAKSWESVFQNGNMEFPQMDVCFPFSILSLGRSDMSLARNTWELSAINRAVQHQNQCWYQSAINLARMGFTPLAASYTVEKFRHSGYRFPTFYHTYYAGNSGNFCHTPDMDHSGVSMTALQEMIMQTDGRRILLGPAWPAEWNASFKLHAPYQTTVSGRVEGGEVIVDEVTPESRRKDLVIFPLKTGVIPVPVSQGKPVQASATWHQAGYDPAKAVDGNDGTRWGGAQGARDGWLEVNLGKPTSISRAIIKEIAYPSTEEFAIEAQQADGSWSNVATGTSIGSHKELRFTATTASVFRLRLLKLNGNPNIEEFQLHGK